MKFYTPLIILIVFADQLSKWAIIERWYKQDGIAFFPWLFQASERLAPVKYEITSFFNMVMVWNQGVSFGMFNNGGAVMVWLLSAVALVIAVGFYIWMRKAHSALMKTALALVIGGAIGNVWDRLRFHAVADFFDFHIAGYHWPAFNIADAAISIGMILFLLDSFWFNPQKAQVIDEKV